MAISLKVLAPNKNVYQGEAEEVILPSKNIKMLGNLST